MSKPAMSNCPEQVFSVNIKLKYLHHLVEALIVLIMGLFEVLITNMMHICAANSIKINTT